MLFPYPSLMVIFPIDHSKVMIAVGIGLFLSLFFIATFIFVQKNQLTLTPDIPLSLHSS